MVNEESKLAPTRTPKGKWSDTGTTLWS